MTVAAADITAAHIDALLSDLDQQPISRRTVNKYRATLHAIFRFGLSPNERARWDVEQNPVARTRKRREEGTGHLEVFTVDQIEALARAAEDGEWRSGRTYARSYDLLAARSASSASASAQPMRSISCAATCGSLTSDDVTRSLS